MDISSASSMNFVKQSKYRVIYADPPWSFRNWSANGTGRNAISHYDCMDFEALAALPVSAIAADDSVLFLWATDPMLPRAFELITAWGFQFKTVCFYWVKLNAVTQGPSKYFMGQGYWTRGNPEQCLLATRGNPQRHSKSIRKLVVERRREHSRKPDEIRDLIEKLVPGPYIELFARETTPGWDCWGDQIALFDHGTIQTRRQPSGLTAPGAPIAGFGGAGDGDERTISQAFSALRSLWVCVPHSGVPSVLPTRKTSPRSPESQEDLSGE